MFEMRPEGSKRVNSGSLHVGKIGSAGRSVVGMFEDLGEGQGDWNGVCKE